MGQKEEVALARNGTDFLWLVIGNQAIRRRLAATAMYVTSLSN